MADQDWRIHVRDRDRVNQGPLETYERATIRLRLNERGSFLIEGCRADDAQVIAMTQDAASQGQAGFMLLKDVAQIVASGPTRQVVESQDDESWTASDTRSSVARVDLVGTDDTALLATRVIDPAAVGATEHTVADTDAQSMMHLYVGYHASVLASTDRQIPGLTIAPNSGLGPILTRTYKYDNLLAALQDIALASSLRFDVRQTVDGFTAFYVYGVNDLRSRFTFTVAGGELEAVQGAVTAPQYNHVTRLGKTEIDRQVDTGQDTGSIQQWGRIETVIDGRQSDDADVVASEIAAALTKGAGYESFQVTPGADADGPQFADDYNLGDRVSWRTWDGRQGEGYVVEVEIVLDQDGARVTPTIASTRVAPSSRDSVRALGQRVGRLESWADNANIIGMVELWSGAVADIPVHYALLDGAGGRPDSRGRFLLGAGGSVSPAATGGIALNGSNQVVVDLHHGHSQSHVHSIDHDHPSFTSGTNANNATVQSGSGASATAASHNHDVNPPSFAAAGVAVPDSGPANPATTGDGGSTTQTVTPPYLGLCVIARVS